MNSRQRIVALTVACALFMQTLDSSVLGTALPAIGRDFNLDPVRLHLAMTSYLIALAVFMPMSGWIADRFGTRNVLRVAIVIFVGGSVGCGYSTSIVELVLMRILQGMGGAMMVPVARLALLRAVPKSSLVQAMTWVSVPALLGPVVGPPLGGFLVTYASWPWIFWINVPIGLIGIALATVFFENLKTPDTPKFDRTGFFLSAIAVAGMLFGLELAPREGAGTLPGYGLLACGIAAMLLYGRHARRHAAPIIDLSLLRIATFRVSILAGSLFRIGIGAIPFLLPLMLQESYGHTALSSGLITFSAAAGAIAMKFVAPRALARIGFRKTLTWNAIFAGASIAIVAIFTDTTPVAIMLFVLFVGGFFRSLQFTAINAVSFADLDDRQMSRATGFSAMVQQLSLAIGVSIAALTLQLLPYLRGEAAASESDYSIAFLIVGALVTTSALAFARLEADAGDAVSGHATTIGGASRPPSDTRT